METSIRENDFVLIILTPKYRVKSDSRIGGVGYEGDIMTGEVFMGKDPRKFIPVLRTGDWDASSPSWLGGKYGVDLRGDPYSEDQYHDLLNTLLGTREQPPPVGKLRAGGGPVMSTGQGPIAPPPSADTGPITITGIIVNEVGTPRNDGTQGSALYAVPFQLSRRPSAEWARHLVETLGGTPRPTRRCTGLGSLASRVTASYSMVQQSRRSRRFTATRSRSRSTR